MRALTAGMQTAVGLETTYLVTCWKVTRADTTQFFFTSHVENLIIDGNTYLAASGMSASAIASGSDMAVDNLEVTGALTSDSITDADLLGGKWDYAAIQVFHVDYTTLGLGKIMLRNGTIGAVSSGRDYYKAELRGMLQPLSEFFGRNVTPSCDTDLGSARCTLNLATLTHTGSLTSSTAQDTLISSSLYGWGTDYYVGGLMTLTGSANAGISREIKSYDTTTGAFTLQEGFPYIFTVGQAVVVSAGCDKQLDTCRVKFANIINFQGFPYLPGIDAMLKQGGVH